MESLELLDTLDTLDRLCDDVISSDDDVISSDDDVISSDDEERHKKLLKSIGVKEKANQENKLGGEQRSEAITDVSIYSLVGSKGSKSKVSMTQLTKGLKDSVNVNNLKKNLSKIEKSTTKLHAPLPRIVAERTERDAAYDSASQKVSRWDDIVQQNRRSETLSFPLNHDNLTLRTVDDYIKKFKPKTPLEEQIYDLLKGNKYSEETKDGLTVAEAEALKSVSLEEARSRRFELQKHRALLSYHEAKNRRLKKIKSRRHLRIIRKQKEKRATEDFEQLQQRDPEAAADKMKMAQKARAEERAVLRHRQGSKWAKNRALMAKYDEMTKVQIQEQRKIHSDLTKKALVLESSEEEEESDVDDNNNEKEDILSKLVPPTASAQILHLPKNNPWLRHGMKKDPEEKKEQKNIGQETPSEAGRRARTRSQTAVLGLEAVGGEKKDADEDSSDEEEEFQEELKEIKERKKHRKEMQESDEVENENIEKFKLALVKLRRVDQKMKKKEGTEDDAGDDKEILDCDDTEEGLLLSRARHRTLEDLENVLNTEGDVSTLSEFHRESRGKRERKKEENEEELEYIDPKKVFSLPTKTIKSQASDLEEEAGGMDENRMTIQEAFADDDVVADFIAEKEKNVEESKPGVVDDMLPGWGEWAGVDLEPSKRKRRKFMRRGKPHAPRKDRHLGPVIINEKKDIHIAKYQVNQVPFPYTSKEQFERAFRQPIGQNWNTPSTFSRLTEPRIKTLGGSIIDPMDEEYAFDQSKTQKRSITKDGKVKFSEKSDFRVKRKRGNKKHKK